MTEEASTGKVLPMSPVQRLAPCFHVPIHPALGSVTTSVSPDDNCGSIPLVELTLIATPKKSKKKSRPHRAGRGSHMNVHERERASTACHCNTTQANESAARHPP